MLSTHYPTKGPDLNGQAVLHAQKENMSHCAIDTLSNTKLAMPSLCTGTEEPKAFGSIMELVEYHTVHPLDFFGIVLTNPIEREDAAAGGSYNEEGHFIRRSRQPPSTTSTPKSLSSTSPHPSSPSSSPLQAKVENDRVEYAVLRPAAGVKILPLRTSDNVEYAILEPRSSP